MKINYYYLPEIGIVLVGILVAFIANLAGIAAKQQVVIYVALLLLLVTMRISRKAEAHSVSIQKMPPELENPRDFKHGLILFCEDELTDFRTVLRTFTADGPMVEQPDTNLVAPVDLELYFEAIDSLEEVGQEISRFIVSNLECEITSYRVQRKSPEPVIIIEATRIDRSGVYVFVISPAKTEYHFRLQIGRQLSVAA